MGELKDGGSLKCNENSIAFAFKKSMKCIKYNTFSSLSPLWNVKNTSGNAYLFKESITYPTTTKTLDVRTSRERARKSGDSLSTKARGEAPEADRLPGLPGPTVGARARARARALSVEAKR